MLPTLRPPDLFGIVEPSVYRSSSFNPENFDFIQQLGLRTVVFLSADVSLRAVSSFIEENNIEYINLGSERALWGGLGWRPLSEDVAKRAIEIMLDERLHPVLLTCTTGVHQTGTVVGCLRKLQEWSMTAIVDEFRNSAGSTVRTRENSEHFIELFDTDLVTLPQRLPPWFVKQSRMLQRESEEVRLKCLHVDSTHSAASMPSSSPSSKPFSSDSEDSKTTNSPKQTQSPPPSPSPSQSPSQSSSQSGSQYAAQNEEKPADEKKAGRDEGKTDMRSLIPLRDRLSRESKRRSRGHATSQASSLEKKYLHNKSMPPYNLSSTSTSSSSASSSTPSSSSSTSSSRGVPKPLEPSSRKAVHSSTHDALRDDNDDDLLTWSSTQTLPAYMEYYYNFKPGPLVSKWVVDVEKENSSTGPTAPSSKPAKGKR